LRSMLRYALKMWSVGRHSLHEGEDPEPSVYPDRGFDRAARIRLRGDRRDAAGGL
jgi:hypothetical protein